MFLGLSAGGILKPEMVATMAAKPIILALANPYPEILPEDAKRVRPDAIIATGRSDYPNQVNNAVCFPYIFRGALDAVSYTHLDVYKRQTGQFDDQPCGDLDRLPGQLRVHAAFKPMTGIGMQTELALSLIHI